MTDDKNKPTIRIGGNVTGGKVNIGGTETYFGDVNINYSALTSGPAGSPKDELKALMKELEDALKQVPDGKAEEVEAVQALANQAVAEVAKEKPNKAMLRITREGLIAAAENLLAVAPIVSKIAGKLLTGWINA